MDLEGQFNRRREFERRLSEERIALEDDHERAWRDLENQRYEKWLALEKRHAEEREDFEREMKHGDEEEG